VVQVGLIERTTDNAARWLWPLSVANLLSNIAIILTGGAVRLTGSGLGCPTWPRCTAESYVPRGELGIHGAIEFGNRMLTFALVAVAIACWLATLGHRRRTKDRRAHRLATAIALGVPAQAIIGGFSVLTDLNPWVVSLHLMVSLAMVALCVVLLAEVRPSRFPGWRDRPTEATRITRRLVIATYAVLWIALYLGTVVTGSGPHAGDADSPRNNLDSAAVSHLHAATVYTLMALTIGLWWVARQANDRVLMRSALMLLAVEATQAAIGIAQVNLGLPELLVALHLLGAALAVTAATHVVLNAGFFRHPGKSMFPPEVRASEGQA
jgi:heme a synthase